MDVAKGGESLDEVFEDLKVLMFRVIFGFVGDDLRSFVEGR